MLQTAQNVTAAYGLARQQLDEFAVESHRKYGVAWDKGIYGEEIIPLESRRRSSTTRATGCPTSVAR